MKKIIIGFIATALVAAVAAFGYNKVTANDDCCKEGAACCKPGAACCVKK
ncbi:MAG TPA: hypothetical protein VL728_03710 [Cyclobacteriaceae bacterium]|nr:hypothetical protein [Cyclobacteriaceae bacterium]